MALNKLFFSVDGILENAPQNEVFDSCASRLIKETLDGYNWTLFAYGQTGAGKTHTMTGKNFEVQFTWNISLLLI